MFSRWLVLSRRCVLLLAACLACGKTSPSQHDAGPGDAALDLPSDLGAAESGADLARETVADADAPASSSDAPAPDEAPTDAGAVDGPADAPRSDAADAADDLCAGLPGSGACLCDGFVMPNPAGTNLPNPPRYETVGSDEVLDDVTGLVWERSPTVDQFTQSDGVTHCLAATTGGHGPWRLPTAIELVSVHDFTSKGGLAPPFPADPVGEGWSSTLLISSSTGIGLTVSFNSQYSEVDFLRSMDHVPVRCVRTGGAPPPRCYRAGARYFLDSPDVATDRATGLAWRRHIQPDATDWNGSKTGCAALGGGWRLPSLSELDTIVDHTVTAPSIDAVTFPGTPMTKDHPEIPDAGAEHSPFWTSSGSAFDAGQAWVVDFVPGYSLTNPVAMLAHARCVR